MTLDGYSKHLVVGTGDGTFSLGDVNGDQKVDALDLTALDAKLNQTLSASDLAVFDLSGDGKVDITDLTYVNRNAGNSGQAWVLDTAAIVPAQLDAAGLSLTGGDGAEIGRASCRERVSF